MSNNASPKATPWARYREQRLAHTRELQALAVACARATTTTTITITRRAPKV